SRFDPSLSSISLASFSLYSSWTELVQGKMSTIHGTDNLAWNDEQTRFYLELRLEEKLKGNIRNQIVNDAGRQSIIDRFYEV
ncbi:unnamed protein product, partial [Arabidopsis halleri]